MRSNVPPVLLVICFAWTGCEEEPVDPCARQALLGVGDAVLSVAPCTGAFALGTELDPGAWLQPLDDGRPAVAWAHDELTTEMVQGRFTFVGSWGNWVGPKEGSLLGLGTWSGEGEDGTVATVFVGAGPEGSLSIHAEVTGEPERISLAFACRDGEHFFGLGEQLDGTDHTGKTRLLYTSEPGIGQSDYPLDERDLLRGRVGDSYFPVPWTVTDRGLGLTAEGTNPVRFYLCGAEEPGVLRIEVWDDLMELDLFPGPTARDAVAAWTRASGPPVAAPDWAWGPWVALQRGSAELLRVANLLRSEHIPATALWAQDWIGGRDQAFGGYDLFYHWTWDEETYPDLPGAIEEINDLGFAFLGYFNPFVTDDFPEWEEAMAGGYLIEGPDGLPREFGIVDRHGSMVDLDDPLAWDWARGYMDAAVDLGIEGWMCDFAEWLPLDAQVGDGSLGQAAHNRYPLQWQRLNMEALDDGWGAGNALCFNRSGWAGTQAITPVTWGGDQETGWGRDDGMPSAREIGVGLGLSGIGRYGSDIAGFTSVFDDPSTRELYFRWVEMGAFEPVMRTHDGLNEAENWSWERDAESLDHFRRYAVLHLRMLPFWLAMDRIYREVGLPIMRHGILVERAGTPGAAAVRDAPDQHFLGDDLLVAPVVTEGATERTVVLPPGRWYGLLDDGRWEGGEAGATVTVPAAVTEIPVLVREGALLPLLAEDIETTRPASDGNVVTLSDRDEEIHWVLFHADTLERSMLLADDSLWTLRGVGPASDEAPSLDGGAAFPDCADAAATDCVADRGPGRIVVRVTLAQGVSSLDGGGWVFEVDEGRGRTGTVELRY